MKSPYILPPDPARLIEGLRDTGYDFNTALADIVDNSVDATATKIDIKIMMDIDGDIVVTIADNGCGMDQKTLLEGMKYGSAVRTDPRRLGKFGLGLKTASTAFCRKLSVITRNNIEAEFLKACWDLDHVVHTHEWELLFEDVNEIEKEIFLKVAADTSGTLVVWEKVDRLMKSYTCINGKNARRALDKIIDSFSEHASMIYQRFLDSEDRRARNIEIKINGTALKPWNPFCESESETELVAEKTVPVELESGIKSDFVIRAFILPKKENFSTPEASKVAKLSNDMQGMYIYRENRLIHYADWLGMFIKEPHGTLLRVEFSFNHILDDAFQVDIKKSRILLNEDLYDWILNQFIPAPRNAADERYRKGERKKAAEAAKDAHDNSNRSISEIEKEISNTDIKIIDSKNNEVEVTNKSGSLKIKLKIGTAAIPGQVCVQPVDSVDDGLLWEPALIDGHHAVRINTGHPYYHKVYIPNLSSGVTVQGMDSLLWSLVEAELCTINESTKNHFKELRFEVARLLRRLVDELPEPDLDNVL